MVFLVLLNNPYRNYIQYMGSIFYLTHRHNYLCGVIYNAYSHNRKLPLRLNYLLYLMIYTGELIVYHYTNMHLMS
nr:MAG TPA: hypothetical protein [Caudoviricetes sp.]